MNDSGNITQDREEDINEKVGVTAALQEYSEGRDKDGKKDFADVRAGERHVESDECGVVK